ncbi:MAG: metalloregulator ArsR/SmtB family transcription factor [Phycisphaeraceae bacterium]
MSRPYRTHDDERDVFRALAHPVRRRIIVASLDQPQTFEQLRQQVHRSDATVAGHLRILREARLLTVKRDGRFVNYRVNQHKLRTGFLWLAQAVKMSVPTPA